MTAREAPGMSEALRPNPVPTRLFPTPGAERRILVSGAER